MNDTTQSRKWLLTINNPDKYDLSHEKIKALLSTMKGISYWCMCDEVGKNETYHTHLYLYRQNPMRFSMIKNKFKAAHIDYCRGTSEENRDYIKKEGKYKGTKKEETNLANTFEEYGEIPLEHQGQRNDLIDLYDMIKDGRDNFEILEENPSYMMQLDKIESCRQIIRGEKFKNTFRDMHVEYWSGKTGQGKTRTVMERHGYENVYRVTDYLHPFDNYKGQDILLFDEYDSDLIRIQDMLNFLDGYPLDLPCRYNNKVACYTKVYIISNMSLTLQYSDIQRNNNETWKAFLRRIHAVKIFDENGLKDYKSANDYIYGWHPVNEKEIPFKEEKQEKKKEKKIKS